jgi:hypothetical protein
MQIMVPLKFNFMMVAQVVLMVHRLLLQLILMAHHHLLQLVLMVHHLLLHSLLIIISGMIIIDTVMAEFIMNTTLPQ